MIVRDLVDALRAPDHEVDTVDIPTTSRSDAVLEEALAIRLLEVSRGSDVLIAIRPPSHGLRHPNKRLWFIHHHRTAYDLWGTQWQDLPSTPDVVAVRDPIRRYDEVYLREAQKIFTNSQTVADRLRAFNGIEAEVLYPPLGHPERFFWEEPEDYVFYPCRITSHRVFHHLFVRIAAYYGEAGARVARESVSEDRQPVWERDEEVVKCFDGGCFGELPQGAVARVAAGDFDAAGAELRRLMSDAARRRELGAHARRLASEREPDYAQALIEFVAEVQHATPTLRSLDRVGDELGAMRADPSLPIFDDIASDFGRILAL